ncbi:MAG TPA: LemA family protein, partial [Gammaproteobacteria bacterium]|nr:LemA family protein [Gammaproteobacteria bacterium]
MDLIVTIILIVLIAWGIIVYNRLITDLNRIKAAWSDIDIQLRRRHDLIPQLVEAVKAYASYERKTLEEITSLREQSKVTDRVSEVGDIESELEGKVNH